MRWNLFKTCIVLAIGLVLTPLLSPLLAQDGDRLYVTDRLRLSLYENANDSSRVIKLLVSGDLLIVEQVSGLYALVTAADGTRGWVKRGFLVSEPTANLQLAEELQKNETLQAEVNRLGNAAQVINQYELDMNAMNETNISLEQEKAELQARVDELQEEVGIKQSEIDDLRTNDGIDPQMLIDIGKQYWPFLLAALLALIVLIFILSKLIVEARIRNHFQGIKVW